MGTSPLRGPWRGWRQMGSWARFQHRRQPRECDLPKTEDLHWKLKSFISFSFSAPLCKMTSRNRAWPSQGMAREIVTECRPYFCFLSSVKGAPPPGRCWACGHSQWDSLRPRFMHPLRRASKLWKFHVIRSEDRLKHGISLEFAFLNDVCLPTAVRSRYSLLSLLLNFWLRASNMNSELRQKHLWCKPLQTTWLKRWLQSRDVSLSIVDSSCHLLAPV